MFGGHSASGIKRIGGELGDTRGEVDKQPLPLVKGKGGKGIRGAKPLFDFYLVLPKRPIPATI